jgi:peptide/nickel transport system permease protein
MGRFLLRRFIITVPVLFLVTLVSFFFINMAPGDPAMFLISPETASLLGPDWVAQQRHLMGLDQPIAVRYVRWIEQVAHGNLGYSMVDNRPVGKLLAERLVPTLELMGIALAVGILIAIPVGVISAVKHYSILDYVVTVLSFIAASLPVFFVGMFLIFIFALSLGWLPTSGMITTGQPRTLVDLLRHMIMPGTVLAIYQIAPLVRYTRSGMLEVLGEDYVRTARAKGLRNGLVLRRHALRNALIPLVTVIAMSIPGFFGGTVITEQVFQWPGMGLLMVNSIAARDYPALMGMNVLIASLVIICNLAADLLYALIDPRIRLS